MSNVIDADFRPYVVIVTKREVIDLGPDAVGEPLEEVFGDAVPAGLRGAKRYRHEDQWIVGRPEPDADSIASERLLPDRLEATLGRDPFERAKGRCEACGRPHGREVRCLADDRWYDEEQGAWRCYRGSVARHKIPAESMVRLTKVALGTAHLDHDPTDKDVGNLKT